MDSISVIIMQKTTVSVEDANIDQLNLSHYQTSVFKIISIQEKKIANKEFLASLDPEYLLHRTLIRFFLVTFLTNLLLVPINV